jgi:hypothetical protein
MSYKIYYDLSNFSVVGKKKPKQHVVELLTNLPKSVHYYIRKHISCCKIKYSFDFVAY